MSSRYSVICLTHDPALNEEDDFGSAEEAIGAVTLGTGPAAQHRACDVVIGRWSYPLIEVGCPSNIGTDRIPARRCYHNGPVWTYTGWLRLLHHSRMNDDATDRLVGSDAQCWPEARLDRLEPLFRLEEG